MERREREERKSALEKLKRRRSGVSSDSSEVNEENNSTVYDSEYNDEAPKYTGDHLSIRPKVRKSSLFDKKDRSRSANPFSIGNMQKIRPSTTFISNRPQINVAERGKAEVDRVLNDERLKNILNNLDSSEDDECSLEVVKDTVEKSQSTSLDIPNSNLMIMPEEDYQVTLVTSLPEHCTESNFKSSIKPSNNTPIQTDDESLLGSDEWPESPKRAYIDAESRTEGCSRLDSVDGHFEDFDLDDLEDFDVLQDFDGLDDLDGIDFDDDIIEAQINSFKSTEDSILLENDFVTTNINIPSVQDGCIPFYYFDAYEKMDGGLMLFGKVFGDDKQLETASLAVDGIQRTIYFLPRISESEYCSQMKGHTENELVPNSEVKSMVIDEPTNAISSYNDYLKIVEEEISALLFSQYISIFKIDRIEKCYAFGLEGIPDQAMYIRVSYSFQLPILSVGNLKEKSFSHVFGLGTKALEQFLLDRKIMGPSWLCIKPSGYVKRNASWCKVQIELFNVEDINVIAESYPPPPLIGASISISTRSLEVKSNNSGMIGKEVAALSISIYDKISLEGGPIDRCSKSFTIYQSATVNSASFNENIQTNFKHGSNGDIAIYATEKQLFGKFLSILNEYNPDILIGHDLLGNWLSLLLGRMRNCKISEWSRIGRLNLSQWPKAKGRGITEASYAERQALTGRLLIDVSLSARETNRLVNYELGTMVKSILKVERLSLDLTKINWKCTKSIALLLLYMEEDSKLIYQVMTRLQVIPLTKQLTNIAGNLWSNTLRSARADRVEYLLLHEFHQLNYILPDRSNSNANFDYAVDLVADATTLDAADDIESENEEFSKTIAGAIGRKKKAAYTGGLVLEPKRGLYTDIVLLLDFNSLYPSIIQEYNICYTTVKTPASTGCDEPDYIENTRVKTNQGVLPRLLASLVSSRRDVKLQMSEEEKMNSKATLRYNLLNTRQQALKLTANSMYGCLGFDQFRFRAQHLAQMVTAYGRKILKATVDAAREINLDVIYGDTDSVMINSHIRDIDEALKIGTTFKTIINERYSLLEIEIDAIFERLLLLRKKRYAALVREGVDSATGTIKRKVEMKGIEVVRRDWCPLSTDVSLEVLNCILGVQNSNESFSMKNELIEGALNNNSTLAVSDQIHSVLRDCKDSLRNGRILIEKFIISKCLAKDPSLYPDAKGQPHIVVALAMRSRGLTVRAGDTIPYIICVSGRVPGSRSVAERAFHPDEVEKKSLVIDIEWYLTQQLISPITRYCELVPGMTAASVAISLGMDPKKYVQATQQHFGSNPTLNGPKVSKLTILMTDSEKFKECKDLSFQCSKCEVKCSLSELLQETMAREENSIVMMRCNKCQELINPSNIYLNLLDEIKLWIQKHHEGIRRCDMCHTETRRMSVYADRCPSHVMIGGFGDFCKGRMTEMYAARNLYLQLLYYRHLVNKVIDSYQKVLKINSDENVDFVKKQIGGWKNVEQMVQDWIDRNSYSRIDLKPIFSFCHMTIQNV